MSTATTAYTLRDRGADLRVETWVEPEGKKRNRARLLAQEAATEAEAPK